MSTSKSSHADKDPMCTAGQLLDLDRVLRDVVELTVVLRKGTTFLRV